MKFTYTVNAKPDNANGNTRGSSTIINTKDPEKIIALDNLSHGLTYGFEAMIVNTGSFCRYSSFVEEDGSYDPSDYGMPDEILTMSLKIIDDDHNESIQVSMISEDEGGYLYYSMNDCLAIKCQHDGYVALDDSSIKIHIGVSLNKNCPHIANYLANQLAVFDLRSKSIYCNKDIYSKIDDIINTGHVMNNTYMNMIVACYLTKYCDVICISRKPHGDVSSKDSYEHMYDSLLNIPNKNPNINSYLHKVIIINKIDDKEFGMRYLSDNAYKECTIESLKSFFDSLSNTEDEEDEEEEPNYIAVPVDLTDPENIDKSKEELREYIEDYVNQLGIHSTNVDGIVEMILNSFKEKKKNSENGEEPGVYIGGITISYNSETGAFDSLSPVKGIDITKEEILNVLSDDFKDDAIEELVQRLRDEGRITDDISDTIAISIIKSIIDDDNEYEDGGNE